MRKFPEWPDEGTDSSLRDTEVRALLKLVFILYQPEVGSSAKDGSVGHTVLLSNLWQSNDRYRKSVIRRLPAWHSDDQSVLPGSAHTWGRIVTRGIDAEARLLETAVYGSRRLLQI